MGGSDWLIGKNHDTFGPLGPWLVTKDEIAQAVWSELPMGEAPSDAMIANAVSKLRAALGEDNAARITTIPRAGYRFDGG